MTVYRFHSRGFAWALLAGIVLGLGGLRAQELPVNNVRVPEPPVRIEPTSAQLASCILLYGRQSIGILQSTGIVIDEERGWAITAWHFWSGVEKPGALAPLQPNGKLEVAPSPYLNHYLQGKAATVRLVWHDAASDLALVAVANLSGAKAATLSRGPPAPTERLFALGNPSARNAMWQVEPARVQERKWADWTYASGQRVAANLIEFTVSEPLSTGFSGGPLFNAKGEVAGAIIAAVRPDGLSGYAVEPGAVQRLVARAHAQLVLPTAADGDRAAAKRHANLAIALAPNDCWGYLVRGRLRLDLDRPGDAREDFETALRVMPLTRALRGWQQSLELIGKSAAAAHLGKDEPRTLSGN